jgi:hypothetical protein
MTEEEKEELRAIVREVLVDMMSEVRPMPVPSGPVTEISIRIMPSGAIETLGVGHVGYPYPFGCWPSCPPTAPCLYFGAAVPTDEKSAQLLQHIKDATGEGQEDVINKMGIRIMKKQLAEEIEKYAQELQQADEGEK